MQNDKENGSSMRKGSSVLRFALFLQKDAK
jgi:hypothetical protein